MEGVVNFEYDLDKLTNGVDVVRFLAESGIIASKGEARKLIQGGGISINRRKVSDPAMQVTDAMLLHKLYLLVQKGKKNYYLVRAILPAN